MELDQGEDPELSCILDSLPHQLEVGFVELPLPRFDPGPHDPQPNSVDAQLLEVAHIFFREMGDVGGHFADEVESVEEEFCSQVIDDSPVPDVDGCRYQFDGQQQNRKIPQHNLLRVQSLDQLSLSQIHFCRTSTTPSLPQQQKILLIFILEFMSRESSTTRSDTQQPSSNHQSLNQARLIRDDELLSTPVLGSSSQRSPTQSMMKKVHLHQSEPLDLKQLVREAAKEEKTPEGKRKGESRSDKGTRSKQKQSGKGQKSCPICLGALKAVRGSLSCLHQFCFGCIEQWGQSSTLCPCCRIEFTSILKLTRNSAEGAVKETKRVLVEQKRLTVESEYDHFICYQCGRGDDEEVLLICDDCDFYCCHIYCDPQLPGNSVPEEDWFCIYCRERRRRSKKRPTRTGDLDLRNSSYNRTRVEYSERPETREGVSSRTRSHGLFENIRSRSGLDRQPRSRRAR